MNKYENAAHSAYMGLDRAAVLRFMIVSLFMLLMIDNVLTYVGVAYMNGIEGNPLCAPLGLELFTAIKVVLSIAWVLVIYHIGKEYVAKGICCSGVLCLLYGGVAVNNVIQLGLVG